jgi:hypothetical protein
VKDDAWHAIVVAISNAPDLQGYSVRVLYSALQASLEQVCTYMDSEFHFIINHILLMYLNIYVLLNYNIY